MRGFRKKSISRTKKVMGISIAAILLLFMAMCSGTDTAEEQVPEVSPGILHTQENSFSSPVPTVTAPEGTAEQDRILEPIMLTPAPVSDSVPTSGAVMLTPMPAVAAAPGYNSESAQASRLSVLFIDVGQGDAALIECDGHYMLVDGGPPEASSKLFSILRSRDISYLDMIIGSHGHADHVGGLAGALNYASVGTVLCSTTAYDSDTFRSFSTYAMNHGAQIRVPMVGESYGLGGATVTILGVNTAQGEHNDTSIILKISLDTTSFLFTGDASREVEERILSSGADLNATVLKVAHHGGSDSTSYPFLREIMPQYAVISVGAGNSYGHPEDAVLSRLRDAGSEVYRTDLHGDVLFETDGENITVTTARDAATVDVVRGADVREERSLVDSAVGYILNTSSKKFHFPGCHSVDQMSPKNRMEFSGSREEVLAMGYTPCGNCKP